MLGQGAVHDHRAQHGAVVTSRGCPSPPSTLSQGLRGLVCPVLLRGRAVAPGHSFPPQGLLTPLLPAGQTPLLQTASPSPCPEQEWPLHGCWTPLPTPLRSGPWRVSTEPLGALPPGLVPPPRPCLPIPLRSLTVSQARWPAALEEEAPGGAALPRGGEAGRQPHGPPSAAEVTRMASPACVTGSWTLAGFILF